MEHDTWSGKILVWATRVHCIWGSLGECASVTPIKGDGLFIHQHLSVTGAGKAVPKGHEFSGSFSTYSVTGKGAPEARDSPQTNSCRCLWLVPGWYTWKLQSLRRHGSPLKASAAESTDLCSTQQNPGHVAGTQEVLTQRKSFLGSLKARPHFIFYLSEGKYSSHAY